MTDFQGPCCETCRFTFVDGDARFCRRYPPITLLMPKQPPAKPGELMFQSRFPTMLASGWCGEYAHG